MGPPARFERAAFRSEAECSVRLSCEGMGSGGARTGIRTRSTLLEKQVRAMSAAGAWHRTEDLNLDLLSQSQAC